MAGWISWLADESVAKARSLLLQAVEERACPNEFRGEDAKA